MVTRYFGPGLGSQLDQETCSIYCRACSRAFITTLAGVLILWPERSTVSRNSLPSITMQSSALRFFFSASSPYTLTRSSFMLPPDHILRSRFKSYAIEIAMQLSGHPNGISSHSDINSFTACFVVFHSCFDCTLGKMRFRCLCSRWHKHIT